MSNEFTQKKSETITIRVTPDTKASMQEVANEHFDGNMTIYINFLHCNYVPTIKKNIRGVKKND